MRKKVQSVIAWTDYPITELGDLEKSIVPIRECRIISYDGNKYCCVQINGIEKEIRTGYLYSKYGRYNQAPTISFQMLRMLNKKLCKQSGKPASRTVSYIVYEANYQPGLRYLSVGNKKEALRQCRKYGLGSEVVMEIRIENRHGISTIFSNMTFVFNGGHLEILREISNTRKYTKDTHNKHYVKLPFKSISYRGFYHEFSSRIQRMVR